jgi:hypothetical protein
MKFFPSQPSQLKAIELYRIIKKYTASSEDRKNMARVLSSAKYRHNDKVFIWSYMMSDCGRDITYSFLTKECHVISVNNTVPVLYDRYRY